MVNWKICYMAKTMRTQLFFNKTNNNATPWMAFKSGYKLAVTHFWLTGLSAQWLLPLSCFYQGVQLYGRGRWAKQWRWGTLGDIKHVSITNQRVFSSLVLIMFNLLALCPSSWADGGLSSGSRFHSWEVQSGENDWRWELRFGPGVCGEIHRTRVRSEDH